MKLSIRPKLLEDDAAPLMHEFVEAKRAVEEAQRRLRLATDELTKNMRSLSDKTRTVTDGGKTYRITYVQGTRTVIDEDGLQKKIGKIKYRQLCDLKLSKKKLEAALNDAEQVSLIGPFLTEVPNQPYLLLTEGATDDRDTTR